MARRGLGVLGQVPLFAGLSSKQLRRIRDMAEETRFMEGHSVVREGEPGDSFYVILEGEARVVNAAGRTLNRLYPGDFFGEISLLDGGERTATVLSETPLVMLRIGRRAFGRIVEQDAGIGVKMLEELARRLRRIQHPVRS